MATKKIKAPGRDLAAWDKELAEQANMAAGAVANSLGGGGFFSIKGGVLSFAGNELPDGQMACIIVDAVRVNTYFDKPYEEGATEPPACYAIARGENEGEMAPHENAADPQHENCGDCPLNKFNTAATGRGKACRNGWRLAVVPAGDLARGGDLSDLELYEEDYIKKSPLTWFNVPPTSGGAFASYVTNLQSAFKRPPHMFVTRIRVKGDRTKQVVVDFHALLDIRQKATDLVPMLMERHKKARDEIMFDYPAAATEESPRQAQRKRAGAAAGREPVGRATNPRKSAKAPAKAARGRQEPVQESLPAGGVRRRGAPAAQGKAAAAAPKKSKFQR